MPARVPRPSRRNSWRIRLNMEGGWRATTPPTAEVRQAYIDKRASGVITISPKQFPVGPAPVFYDLHAEPGLSPAQIKEIADAALMDWLKGKGVTAKVLDPSDDNKIVAG